MISKYVGETLLILVIKNRVANFMIYHLIRLTTSAAVKWRTLIGEAIYSRRVDYYGGGLSDFGQFLPL